MLLILPVLTELGYPPSHRIPQHGAGRNFIDEACFLREVGSRRGGKACALPMADWNTRIWYPDAEAALAQPAEIQ